MILSSVSMQNSKTDEKSEEGSVKNSDTDSVGKKQSKSGDSPGVNGLKLERTKTNLKSGHKKTKYSGVKDTQGNDKKAIDQRPTLVKEHTSSIPNRNTIKQVEDSLKHELIISSSDTFKISDSYNAQNSEVSKSQRFHNDREKGRGHSKDKHAKEKVLPKPSPPSQQYLEGTHSILGGGTRHGEPAWSSKMAPSPLSSVDSGALSESRELDWLNTVKR